ncbi:MAG: putative porin [Ekhidna sp.]
MRLILSLITVFLFSALSAQIVDDSTKQVYGPSTTKFTFEENILNNVEQYFLVDTSLYDFENKPFFNQEWSRFQNLGSIGTALFPIYYPVQDQIGRTSGLNAYAPYAAKPSTIKYYDTKSPFLNLFGFLGGGNRNVIDVNFSRNINENWNFGFDIQKITTDKQLARNAATDRLVIGSNLDVYTHYKNAKLPYQLLFNVSNFSHKVVEQGGVLFTQDSLRSDFFQYENVSLGLVEAENEVKHNRWHLYHDYQIAEQFQLYHKLDRYSEETIFDDAEGGTTNGFNQYRDFYNNFFLDTTNTSEQTTFKTFENEAGLKGDLANVFYRGYVKLRSVSQEMISADSTGGTQVTTLSDLTEKYIGGYARFDWKDKFAVLAKGEIEQGGEFQLFGSINSQLLKAEYESKKYNVPYVYTRQNSNHHNWSNDFEGILVNRLSGSLNLKYKGIELIPEASFSSYNNFVYLDTAIVPQQISAATVISSIGGHVNISKSNKKEETLHFENEIVATNISGGAADFVRIPALFYNGKYYWDGMFFKDKVPVQVGVNLHAQSSYFGNAYAPEIQQFYVQDDFEIAGYYQADLFINMRVENVSVAFKWNYFNQPSNDGYFASPYYPSQPRAINLSVRWLFFD